MAYTGITGTVQGASPNYDPGVVCGANLDLSGVLPPGQVGNCFSADGELWIGSTSLTAGGTRSKIGNITSIDGSIAVTNGSGTIDLSALSGGECPNAILQEFDDFISFSSNSGGLNGSLAWNNIGSIPEPIDGTADHPGIVRVPSRATAGGTGLFLNESGDNTLDPIVPGGGTLTISWTARLNTLSSGGNTYRATIGIADSLSLYAGTDAYVNGIYFSYTDTVNSGNWVINCTAASVTTSVNTSVAADTDFHTFQFTLNAAGTSVSFYIDNVLVGSAIAANIPTAAITPFVQAVRTAGTTTTIDLDLFWIKLELNNPRLGPCMPSSRIIVPTFAPNAIVQEFDDFLSWNNSAATSKLTWQATGNWDSENGTTANPGIVSCEGSVGSSSRLYLINNNLVAANNFGCVEPGSGPITISWITRVDALSGGGNTYRFSIGLADQVTLDTSSSDSYVNGTYFHYTDTVNGGNWQIKCANTSVTTTVNTSVAATTDFTTFTVSINSDATLVSFYINNVLVGTTISTNIPTSPMTPFLKVVRTAGTMPSLKADLFWIRIDLASPRPGPAPITGSNGTLIQAYRATAVDTTVTSDDSIIGVTDTSSARTITMTAFPAFIGQVWTIKDESGVASVNNITVDGNGNLIDGAATFLIDADYGSINLYWNGTNFSIT
jgi:hypothetical protein